MEELKYKSAIKTIDNVVIGVYTFPSEDGILEKDYKPKEVTPEELKKAIEEDKKRIKKLFERKLKELEEKYGGKYLPNLGSEKYEILDKYRPLVSSEDKILASIDNITQFNEIKEALQTAERIALSNIPKNKTLTEIQISYTFGYDCRDVTADIIGKYLSYKMPTDKEIEKCATMSALYYNFFPVFNYDCQAIKEFLAGYLTFKGFAKRLNPFRKRSC